MPDVLLSQGQTFPNDIALGDDAPVGGWLTDSAISKVKSSAAAVVMILASEFVPPSPSAATVIVVGSSSSPITVHSWSVYDPTTGPVSPPASVAAPPVVLSSEQPFRRLLGIKALSETVAPIFVPAVSPIPQFDTSASTKLRRNTVPLSETSAPLFAPVRPTAFPLPDDTRPSKVSIKGVLPDTVWTAIHYGVAPTTFPLPDDTRPAQLRRPQLFQETLNPVSPPAPATVIVAAHWLGQSEPARLKRNNAASATATADPILATAAAAMPTIVGSSSSQVTVHSWSVYDPTTGPVFPPTGSVVAPTAFPLPDDTQPSRLAKPKPIGVTSIVIAIPVDDLWFESLDVPVRLKGKGQLAETVAPTFPPPPAVPATIANWLGQWEPTRLKPNYAAFASSTADPILAVVAAAMPTIVGSTSSAVVVHSWSVYDPTTGPVLPQAAVTATVPYALFDGDVFRKLRGKASIGETANAPIFVPVRPTSFPLPDDTKLPRFRNPRQFDETLKSIFPPPPTPAPPTIGADWLEATMIMAAVKRSQKTPLDRGDFAYSFQGAPPPPIIVNRAEWIIRARRRGRR